MSFIKKREDPEVKYLNDPKAIIEYSQYLDDVYNVTNDYNPKKKNTFDCVWWHDCWYKH